MSYQCIVCARKTLMGSYLACTLCYVTLLSNVPAKPKEFQAVKLFADPPGQYQY